MQPLRRASTSRTRPDDAESGYILIAVIFMVALVVLSLAIAAPKVSAAIQRDRELELIHRGEQYKRAIKLYYKKFGNYPTSIDQLEKTNNVRFLRKRYLDPITGKDDWKPVLVGQAHLCPLGFFGQPIGAGGNIAGATPVSGMAGSTLGSGSMGSSFGSSSGSFGSGSGSGFGSGTSSSFGSGSGFGSATGTTGTSTTGGTTTGCGQPGANVGTPIATAAAASSTDTGSSSGSIGSTGNSGGFGGLSGSGGSNSSGSMTGTSTTLGGGTSLAGNGFGSSTSTTLGGAPIMGIMPPMEKSTILLYKLKTHYNEWEFNYWPAEDTLAGGSIVGGGGNLNGGTGASGLGGAGTSGTSPGSGAGGVGTSFGGGMSGSGASSAGGFGQGSTTP